jgi:hypothetical protein
MAYTPYGGGYGGPPAAGMSNPRNGITQVLMQQAWPPPGLAPNNISADMPGWTQQDGQPAGAGQPSPPAPAGQSGPGSPMMQQPGFGLPGTMQPGQLPQGMAPQAVTGAPPLPMPPRQY